MLEGLKRKLFGRMPLFCMRVVGDGVEAWRYTGSGWAAVAAEHLPEMTASVFCHAVLRIDDEHCAFRVRQFPADLVAAEDLNEAIELDFPHWVPEAFRKGEAGDIHWLAFPVREHDQWRVAIWVWSADHLRRLQQALPEGLRCTHVMPETAWQIALLRPGRADVLIVAEGHRQALVWLDARGMPRAIDHAVDARDVRRMWHKFLASGNAVEHVVALENGLEPFWLPDGCTLEFQEPALPRYALLAHARQPGVRDWSDPLSWKGHMAMVVGALLVWMMGSALVLNVRGYAVDTMTAQAESDAQKVLEAREHVERMMEKLRRVHALRARQQQPLRLLAELSKRIPSDIWVEVFHLNGPWLDLRGKGKDVSRLLVLLEAVDGVQEVQLLNDIRPDARTGLEIFQLRLMLRADAATARGG